MRLHSNLKGEGGEEKWFFLPRRGHPIPPLRAPLEQEMEGWRD